MQGPVVAVSCGCTVARRGSVQIYYKVTNLALHFVVWQCKKCDKTLVPRILALAKITYFLCTSVAQNVPTTNKDGDWLCWDKKHPLFFRNVKSKEFNYFLYTCV